MSNEDLIRGLQEDLAGEWGAVKRYMYQRTQSFMIPEIRSLFEKEMRDEHNRVTYLSELIVALGGEPIMGQEEVTKAEGLKATLSLDLKLKSQQLDRFQKHAQLANQLGDTELESKLKRMAIDESRHLDKLRSILRSLTLLEEPEKYS